MKTNTSILSQQLNWRGVWSVNTDTPLRFFVHLLFIIEGVLGLVIIFGFFSSIDKGILLLMVWSFVGLAVLAIIFVFILVAFFPRNLVFDKQAHLFERALDYGDDAHIIAYQKLSQANPTPAPKALTLKKEEEENKSV